MIPRTRKELKMPLYLDNTKLQEAIDLLEEVKKPENKQTLFSRLLSEAEEIALCFEQYVKEEGDISNIAEAQDRTRRLVYILQYCQGLTVSDDREQVYTFQMFFSQYDDSEDMPGPKLSVEGYSESWAFQRAQKYFREWAIKHKNTSGWSFKLIEKSSND